MKRRNFINKTVLGLGGMLVMTNVSALANVETSKQILVPLKSVMPQIRHGALSLPQLGFSNDAENLSLPFDWLGEIRRNLFFKNGFQKNESEDIEILSVLYKEVQKNRTEALQIRLTNSETTALIGEEWSTLQNEEGIQLFEREESDALSLYMGYLHSGHNYTQTFKANSELFIHVLEGQLSINGKELLSDYGLALNGIQNLEISTIQQSKIIIFENK